MQATLSGAPPVQLTDHLHHNTGRLAGMAGMVGCSVRMGTKSYSQNYGVRSMAYCSSLAVLSQGKVGNLEVRRVYVPGWVVTQPPTVWGDLRNRYRTGCD